MLLYPKKRNRSKIMRNFLNRIRYKLSFCYGNDELNKLLNILTVVICLISFIPPLRFLYFIALFLLIYTTYRSFSKNIYKRRAELDKYLALKNKIKARRAFRRLVRRERKEYLYFRCPYCKEYLRVPRGRGKILVTCRVCHKKIDKKT